MGNKQFFRQKWTRYLGELRPIHDININWEGIPPSPSVTPTLSITPTPSVTPTITASPTNTLTPNLSPSVTPSNTATPTVTPTQTPSQTASPTLTATQTVTPSITPTNTGTVTPTLTPTQTATVTPSVTNTPSITPTNTPTKSQTPTPSITPTCQEQSMYLVGWGRDSSDFIYSYDSNTFFSGSNPTTQNVLSNFASNDDGTRYAATGTNPSGAGRMFYSNEGTSWTATTLSSTTSFYRATIWDGNKFIVISINEKYLYESTDAISWTANTSVSGLTGTPQSIKYNGTNYVYLTDNRIYSSSDLITWTQRVSIPSLSFVSLDYYASKFWVGQNNGVRYESSDGITWTSFAALSPSIYLNSWGFDGRTMLVGGYGNLSNTTYLFYSTDTGSTWNASTLPLGTGFSIDVESIIHDGYKFMIAVTNRTGQPASGLILESTDGQNWSINESSKSFSGYSFQTMYSFPQPFAYPSLLECNVAPPVTPQPTVTASNTPTPSITPTNTVTPSITPTSTPPTCEVNFDIDNNTTGAGVSINSVQFNGNNATYVSGDNFPVDSTELGTFSTTTTGTSVTVQICYDAGGGNHNINLVDCLGNSFCCDTVSGNNCCTFEGVNISCGCVLLDIIVTNGSCL